MTDIGSRLEEGITKVETAATRVQLTTTPIPFTAKTVVIQALNTNEDVVVVGGKEVVAKEGTKATPEQKGIALATKNIISMDINDPTQVWVDARKNKDGVSWVVLGA